MPAFTVKLISKHADFDAEFKGITAASAKEAGQACLRFMANPDAWLVVTPEDRKRPAPPPLCSKCGGSGSLGPYQDCQYCDGIDRR